MTDTRPTNPDLETDLRIVNERLALFYVEHGDRIRWMLNPHPMLDGMTPSRAIAENKTQRVLCVIESLETGAFV